MPAVTRRTLLALLLAVTVLPAVGTPAHAATLHRRVSVWLPYWSMSAASSSTLTNYAVIKNASPFWYQVDGDAKLVGRTGAGNTDLIKAWHGRGMKVVPTVTESATARDFGAMGASSSRRAAHVATLRKIVTSRAYDGLDLDYERIALFRGAHDDTDANRAGQALTLVARDTCAMLHKLGKTCVITVMARTDDSHTYFRNILATWEYDYRELGKVADTVRVMAYGEHGPSGAAGPIGSAPWVAKIITYAKSTMSPAKTELGIAGYGQDWSSKGNVGVTARTAVANAKTYHATIVWDSTAREMHYTYSKDGVKHTVWYADPHSADNRTAMATSAGLAGVALWAAGQELSGVWPKLKARFTY